MTERVPLVRPELLELAPVAHGSAASAELELYGLKPSDVLDFSVNTNPFGPAPCVLNAIRSADWSRYPGDDEEPLRRELAKRAGVQPEQVVLGNGTAQLISLIALASLRPGDQVGILTPTFSEYRRAAEIMGAIAVEFDASAPGQQLRLVFVCNPNNPTGDYFDAGWAEALLDERPDSLVVLDEAYASFVDDRWGSERLLARGNLVVLRSMTKDHALPGLRLGYLLAASDVALAVERVRPPWSVSSGALRAGLRALQPDAEAHVKRARDVVRRSREILTTGFAQLGFEVRPSAVNFVLMHVGDGSRFRKLLLSQRMVVRDCASFGLPEYVRIACRSPEECAQLVDAVASLALIKPGVR